MIALARGNEPTVLTTNAAAWTAEYVRAAKSGNRKALSTASRWGHPDIRHDLKRDTTGKCAYCEGFVTDVSYAHVEHIKPKSKYPEFAHAWTNLGYSCPVCNTEKGDYDDLSFPVLDPYEEDPADHLVFLGTYIFSKLGDVRGEISLRKLALNRLDLVRGREQRLEKFQCLLERWAASAPPLKDFIAEAIRVDVAEGEFAAATRALAIAHEFPL